MKIALLDCHNVDYKAVADFTRPRKSDYCERHGYDLIYFQFQDIGRFPTWGKVLGMEKHLADYDFVCFLDTDILIMNPEVKIEDQLDDAHNVFIGLMPDFKTGNPTHLSTSAWIMKNSEWSFKFLNKWWDTTKYLDKRYPAQGISTPATNGFGGVYHEQSAFSYLYDIDKDCRANVKMMPFCWFNHRESNYEKGSFLVHFARQGEKIARMRKFLRTFIAL